LITTSKATPLLILRVQWIVASKAIVSVQGIGARRLHVVLVVEPDIITLLSTENSKSSTDDDCRNNDDCQQTSG